jgi:phosphatidylinositol alpha-1,6-mannosyltransferase
MQFPPAIGGVETMSCRLSEHLQKLGEEICILAPEMTGARNFDDAQTLRIKRFPLSDPITLGAKGKQKLALINTLRQTVKESHADLILCTGWDPCAYLANIACSWPPRVPYFVIAHGMELMQLPRGLAARAAKASARRRALSGAKKIIAVSAYTRDRVVELGVQEKKVAVVPNGVVLSQQQRTAGGKDIRRILTTVSRLVPRKGHDTVLRALPRVLEQLPDAIYRIVGTGPELARLRALTEELDLSRSVEFYGQVSDVERERLLNECDVFVLATRESATDFEGLGIAVLEAMQNGKPVVVTRAGGVPEIVDHGVTGLVVEADNTKALARAMIELLSEPARAAEMGRNAEMVVRKRFGWDTIAKRYLEEVKMSLNRN